MWGNNMFDAILVTVLEPSKIIAELRGGKDDKFLLKLGFSKKNNIFSIKFSSEKEQLILIEKLASVDALFSYGYGWAPSQVMSYLKEQKKIRFPYKEIMWRSSGNYEIINH